MLNNNFRSENTLHLLQIKYMKLKLYFLLLSFAFISHFNAQQRVSGTVSEEGGVPLSGTLVLNMATGEKAVTDDFGKFSILAKKGEELRASKINYARASEIISASDVVNFILQREITVIDEVNIGFHPTGNIVKDTKALDQPKKLVALNTEIRNSFKNETIVLPKNTVPSSFGPKNFSAGQVDAVKLVGAAVKLIKKTSQPPITTPTYTETQEFYRRVKSEIDMSFYEKFGLDEFGFETYLLYCDKKFSLAKNYRRNFKLSEIDMILKTNLKDYLKTVDRVTG